ncbi:Cytochrome c55X precursor NirC [Methylomonas albis]|uniref:Cytochrome c n=2 Tax=Methylomonas albis TaxID=1854563 RepID=A0ABR9CY18_9GAMM|nr:cytochrome c [Methylomonas albis]CAD6877809.1 Cytochrome c55X precursor NirC [Methylomonas albis]
MRYCWLLIGLLSPCAFAEQPNPHRQQELLNMLKHDCGSCHGLPPKGGLGPSLMPEALIDKRDDLLLDAIQNGRAGTAMPPWRAFLTVDETGWLIQRLRQP